jgi:hypothetical protein
LGSSADWIDRFLDSFSPLPGVARLISTSAALLAVAVFGTWKIYRLRIRKKNPVARILM